VFEDRELAQKPYEGCLVLAAAHSLRKDRARPGPIETLRRKRVAICGIVHVAAPHVSRLQARERRPGREPSVKVPVGEPWKGKAHGSIQRMAILIRSRSPGTSARVKTWKLRPVGPARCFGTREQRQEKQQAGASVSENGTIPRGRGKLRRAESHERRRYETGPARNRRDQTVKRVAKP
jgi:hypothetical protein